MWFIVCIGTNLNNFWLSSGVPHGYATEAEAVADALSRRDWQRQRRMRRTAARNGRVWTSWIYWVVVPQDGLTAFGIAPG